jgi:hypothetical protein
MGVGGHCFHESARAGSCCSPSMTRHGGFP